MNLILWRHAEAHDAAPNQPDERRRLTRHGEQQAAAMARWLRQHLPKKTRILVSPADRCQMTAQALGLKYEVSARVGVAADAVDLLTAAEWPEHEGAVLVVGHQPSLGRVAALLLGGSEADWSVKKGAIWWFVRRKREDESQTVLRTVINPDLLSKY